MAKCSSSCSGIAARGEYQTRLQLELQSLNDKA